MHMLPSVPMQMWPTEHQFLRGTPDRGTNLARFSGDVCAVSGGSSNVLSHFTTFLWRILLLLVILSFLWCSIDCRGSYCKTLPVSLLEQSF